MKKIKSGIALIICLCMLLCGGIFNASALNEKLVYSYNGTYATLTDCNGGASANVIIPTSVTYEGVSYPVKIIGEKAFSGCKYIQRIAIPKGATAVKSRAFQNCTGLTDVYVPRSVISFAYDAFEGCENVTVHCYKANYQFFSVLGYDPNITIDVVDLDTETDTDTEAKEEEGSGSVLGGIITDIISGEKEPEDFIQIDTTEEGIVQMVQRFIQMFVYIYRTYFLTSAA